MNKEELIESLALNGAVYLVNKSQEEINAGEGLNAFDLSLAMEIFTEKPKEECLDMLLKKQQKVRETYEQIKNI